VRSDSNADFQPFGFAGGLYDADVAVIHFGARDYDPRLGRWAAKDPSRFAGGANLYDYSHADPVNYADPTGNIPILAFIGGGIFILTSGALVSNSHDWGGHAGLAMGEVGGIALKAGLRVAARAVAACRSTAAGAAGRLAARFGTTPERVAVLERAITAEGGLNTSATLARQLAGQRSYIPMQSILDTIGSGARVVDPQGVTGQFMYRSAASFNGSQGTLEVLVHEASGQIRHVLFRSGVAP
jgi:RHS repeat-associated protein